MNVNYNIFRKLLTLDELFKLYTQIDNSIFTNIDIENIRFDKESKNNSIQLLTDILFIEYDLKELKYRKKILLSDKLSFINSLYTSLLDYYPDAFTFIDSDKIQFDEIEFKYYLHRNYIDLSLSGLLMLLDGMEIIES